MIEIESLLEPISPDLPAGIDLRQETSFQSAYHRARSVRTEARRIERQIDLGEQLDPPKREWKQLLNEIPEIIKNESKDLELTTYLIEALIRSGGFHGLMVGLELANSLLQRFWESIYPQINDDGGESRFSHFNGLNGISNDGTLIAPIYACPIIASDGESFSTADYLHAKRIDELPKRQRTVEIENGATSIDDIRRCVSGAPPESITSTRRSIRGSIAALRSLSGFVDERCDMSIVHTSRIMRTLEDCLQSLLYLAGPESPTPEPSDSDEQDGELEEVSTQAPAEAEEAMLSEESKSSTSTSGKIESRHEALRLLLEVAEYFRSTEPHSPISYNIEQLVEWARMPLPELLEKLIPDPEARFTYYTLVGIKAPSDE